ncbi:MAG TPA: allophanate hydrolase subunit 2 family protein, partial [Ornithinimicrobium sp.]|nr:allophanate hydrolase subunit 2 family protein [Ornithinimicrobium sp.]
MITVLSAGALTTVQDRGRPGLAHLGVPRAGALDPLSADLATRLVGNPEDAAVLEVTLGRLEARADVGRWVAVTGAVCPVTVDGQPVAHAQAVWVRAGAVLALGAPA